jgi:hypothetical protein
LPEFCVAIACDVVQSKPIVDGKVKHVICRVPPGRDVPRHDTTVELESVESIVPFW